MQEKNAGLTEIEARHRLRRYGLNLLEKPESFSFLRLGLKQFQSPLMLILLVAFGLTLWLGDTIDATVILLGLLVNAVLGFWQEYRAEKSLEALSKVLTRKVTVIRQGKNKSVNQEEIVPGDLVRLGAGERVSADGILVEGEVAVNEAVLTGEAAEVWKKLSDNILAGTAIVTGEGLMEVKKTGMAMEIGQIAKTLVRAPETKTPLQIRLDEMGMTLTRIVIATIGLLVLLGWVKGIPLSEIIMMAVAVGVAAVPEGLAISLTAILTVGMRRILQRKALVRKLLAAEVLGGVTVICTDKTGTLTEGIMKVKRVITQDQELMIKAGNWAAGGMDQLEVAFHGWAEKAKGEAGINWKEGERVLHRQPFAADKKYSVTLTTDEFFLLGAPEILIRMAAMPEKRKLEEMERLGRFARGGDRLVAVLHRKRQGQTKISEDMGRERWNYLGMVVFEDKVRLHLHEVMREVSKAGIEVKVITGDYPDTGRAVMRQIGMELLSEEVVVGEELETLSPEELERKVEVGKLFARINPEQKLIIVRALQRRGEVVAMTGDGVNDAPALKQADVGIVVSTAAEVARETADMVLLDDNFATIVAAVGEGRGIYKNLRKVVLYLLADSFTQIFLVVVSIIAGLPMVLTTVQVLWINLITDTLPSIALTVDPHIIGLLDKPPRKADEPIINAQMKVLIGVISVVIAVVVFGYFVWLLLWQRVPMTYAQTSVFSLTALACILVVFSSRSMMTPIWRDKVFRNKWLIWAAMGGIGLQLLAVYWPRMQVLMGTTALELSTWGTIGVFCFLIMAIVELVKYYFWSRRPKY